MSDLVERKWERTSLSTSMAVDTGGERIVLSKEKTGLAIELVVKAAVEPLGGEKGRPEKKTRSGADLDGSVQRCI